MRIACLAAFASLRGPLLFTALVSFAGAQNQTWIRQFGATEYDVVGAAAPDGSGGVYLGGATFGSLGGPNAGNHDVWLAQYEGVIAARYCYPAAPDSTGQPRVLTAAGSNAVVDNDLTVDANQLALNSFGFFLTRQAQGLVTQPGGYQGVLCLGGSIGRHVGPGQIQSSGSAGAFSLTLDLTMVPTPTGFVAVQPGDTWNFQAWHRDATPGPTSNSTDAVSVTFLQGRSAVRCWSQTRPEPTASDGSPRAALRRGLHDPPNQVVRVGRADVAAASRGTAARGASQRDGRDRQHDGPHPRA